MKKLLALAMLLGCTTTAQPKYGEFKYSKVDGCKLEVYNGVDWEVVASGPIDCKTLKSEIDKALQKQRRI